MMGLLKWLVIMLPNLSPIVHAQIFGWNCANTPNACNNACYAIQCGNNPLAVFTRGPAGPANALLQRKRSGCASHPCSALNWAAAGTQCDEFPFASTAEGGSGAYLRCIPGPEGNSQGGQLANFYRGSGTVPGQQFGLTILNFAALPYCNPVPANPNPCANDGQEFQSYPHLLRRGLGTQQAFLVPDHNKTGPTEFRFRQFLTEQGTELALLANSNTSSFLNKMVYVAGESPEQIVTEITPNK